MTARHRNIDAIPVNLPPIDPWSIEGELGNTLVRLCESADADIAIAPGWTWHNVAPEYREPPKLYLWENWVYFIHCPLTNLVKIGTTRRHPDERFKHHAISSPTRLVKLGVIRGSTQWEQRLHRRFRHHHSHGEWFRLEGRLADFIARWGRPWPEPGVNPRAPRRNALIPARPRPNVDPSVSGSVSRSVG